MILDQAQILQTLRKSHLFNHLDGQRLELVANRIEAVSLREGEVLFEQGAPGDHFFLIYSGRIQVVELNRNGERELATLVPGDYFGEESLLTGRTRSTTSRALTDTVLLRLSASDFRELIRQIPILKAILMVSIRSRRNMRKLDYSWLANDEVIYLAVRRHGIFLILKLILPLLAFFLSGAGFFLLSNSAWAANYPPFICNGVFMAFSVLWAAWNAYDWSNDYYLVTNQRVARLERVAGIYDSRQEAPLGTILSVDMNTSQWGRIFGYGNVNVRTYTGFIILSKVGQPQQVSSLVEEQWFRSKSTTEREEAKAMGEAIRTRLAGGDAGSDVSQGTGIPVQPVNTLNPALPKPGWTERWFSNFYTMRFEEHGAVTYRKHWFILIKVTWAPAILLLSLLALMGLRLFNVISILPLNVALIVGGALALATFLWYLYQYLDWRNDIYQVTPDQIIDLEKKPLGNEEKKSAPLDNILSVNYERRGILGQIFNYGTVYISVGASTFSFDQVFNPSAVQQDIFRSMAERMQRKKTADAAAERIRVSDWFATYDNYTRQMQLNKSPYANPPAVPDFDAVDPDRPDGMPSTDDLPEGWQSYPFLGVDPSDPDV